AAADAVARSAILGHFLFQGGDFGAEDHLAGAQYTGHGVEEVAFEFAELAAEIAQRHAEQCVHGPPPCVFRHRRASVAAGLDGEGMPPGGGSQDCLDDGKTWALWGTYFAAFHARPNSTVMSLAASTAHGVPA